MAQTSTSTRVVKVLLVLNAKYDQPLAVVHTRGGRQEREQFLTDETKRDLGSDLFGYFEAELVAGIWWIGKRLPDGNRGW